MTYSQVNLMFINVHPLFITDVKYALFIHHGPCL